MHIQKCSEIRVNMCSKQTMGFGIIYEEYVLSNFDIIIICSRQSGNLRIPRLRANLQIAYNYTISGDPGLRMNSDFMHVQRVLATFSRSPP